MMPAGMLAPLRVMPTMKQIIDGLGLAAPNVVLDAGDPASLATSSDQTWQDVQNSNDFFVGTTGGVDADEPVFEGTIGGLTAAFACSNTLTSTFHEASDLSFAESWHKDNAAFTFAALIYLPTLASTRGAYLFSTCDGSTSSRGILATIGKSSSVRQMELGVTKGSSPYALVVNANVTAYTVENSWNFVAIALNESTGANGVTFHANGQNVQATSTYSSPSASGTTSPYEVFSPVTSTAGLKIKTFAAWSSRLTTTELNALYAAVKAGREPFLP